MANPGTDENPGASPTPSPPPPETPAEDAPTAETATLDLSKSKLAAQPPAAPEAEAEAEEKEAPAAPVDLEALGRTVEALLFAAEEAVSLRELARAAGGRSAIVKTVLERIRASYEERRQPWELVEVGGGYRLVTRAEYFPAIQRLRTERAQRKLTQAALETLALIAYSKEPIGRAEIESVRGVDAGPILRQLLDRKLIRIAGRGAGLGQPLLYGVAPEFLQHFGLNSAEQLPRPGEFKSP